MLYECVTGTVPFLGQSMAVIAQHISAAPTPPRFKNPEISPELETLILGLLAKDPSGPAGVGPGGGRGARAQSKRSDARRRGRRHRALDPAHVPPPQPEPSLPSARSAVDHAGAWRETPPAGSIDRLPSAVPARVPVAVPRRRPWRCLHRGGAVASPLARECSTRCSPSRSCSRRRTLSVRPLSGLSARRLTSARVLPAPPQRRSQRRPRAACAGDDLAHDGRHRPRITSPAPPSCSTNAPDIRPALNPVVVVKYLASRDTPARRKTFRADPQATPRGQHPTPGSI